MKASLTVPMVRLTSSASWRLRRQPAAAHTSVAVRRWSLRAVLPRRFRSSALRASGAGRLATDRSGRLARRAVAGCRHGGGADHRVRGRKLSTVRRHGRCRTVVFGSGGEQTGWGIPSISPRATTRCPGGKPATLGQGLAADVAPGAPRGRAAPDRRDAPLAPACKIR
jgi:hypothetical protein